MVVYADHCCSCCTEAILTHEAPEGHVYCLARYYFTNACKMRWSAWVENAICCRENYKIILYADDTNYFVACKSLESAKIVVNKILSHKFMHSL